MRTSPAAAAAGGLKAPNSAPTTACWARCCRARQATGSQAAVTEASSLSGVGADDLAAVALDAQRDTSTSTVGLGVDARCANCGATYLQNALELFNRSLLRRTP